MRAEFDLVAAGFDALLPSYGAINQPTVTVASAASVAIGAQASDSIIVSGSNTITGFDTAASGIRRFLVFSGAPWLAHNATSLILPGAANIQTVAGDAAEFVSLGSGNWRCVNFQPSTVTGSGAEVRATSPIFAGNVGIGVANPTRQLSLGNDASSTSTKGIGFAFTGLERGSVTYTGSNGEMRLVSGYAGYGGFITQATNGIDRTTLDADGNFLLISATGGLGYGPGSGGTVTQATNKYTAVTLNKPNGLITMNNAALAAGAYIAFTINNSLFAANDMFCINLAGGFAIAGSYQVNVENTNAGSILVSVKNVSGGPLSEAIQLKFVMFKGSSS